jgi:hypothetical protein
MMNESNRSDDDVAFGNQLLGMQQFSAVRAAQYRAEISNLLTHRLTTHERWGLGLGGPCIGGGLSVAGISMASANEHPEFAGFEQARWMMAAVFGLTGLLLGGWLLWIAFQGTYSRRLGDVVGLLIATVMSSGAAIAFLLVAFATENEAMRVKLLLGISALFVILLATIFVGILQRMHRQTQEKLLRMDYRLTEICERLAK